MSEPLSSVPASSPQDTRPSSEPAVLVHAAAPSGPSGGYAAISIGRWWQGAKAGASR